MPHLWSGTVQCTAHLWVEIVDAGDGILDVPSLHSFADLHAVGDGMQVHPRAGPRLALKCLCSLDKPLPSYTLVDTPWGWQVIR